MTAHRDTHTPTHAEDLAAAERRSGQQLADGAYRWVLLGCVAVYLVSLFLPFVGAAPGFKVLLLNPGTPVTIAEYAFTWLSFLGLGVLTTLSMLARRYGIGAAGWVLTAMAAVNALLSVWLRSTSTLLSENQSYGFFIAVAAVVVATFAYIPAMVRRGDEQQAIAVERATAQDGDALTQFQREAATKPENPLLIDDRRARAAERHKHPDGSR